MGFCGKKYTSAESCRWKASLGLRFEAGSSALKYFVPQSKCLNKVHKRRSVQTGNTVEISLRRLGGSALVYLAPQKEPQNFEHPEGIVEAARM